MIPLIGSLSFATGASVFKLDATDMLLLIPNINSAAVKEEVKKDDYLNYELGAHFHSWWKRLFWDISFFCGAHKCKVTTYAETYSLGAEKDVTALKSFFTYGAQVKIGYRHRSHLPGLYFTMGFSDMLLQHNKKDEFEDLGTVTRHYATPFWGFGFDIPIFKRCHTFIEFQHKISPRQNISPDKGFKPSPSLITKEKLEQFRLGHKEQDATVKLSHWKFLLGVQFNLLRSKNAI